MKLIQSLSLLVAFAGAAGMVASQGCGSSDDGGGASSGAGRTPPAPPSGAAPSDTPARTFAVNQIFLGETDRKGAPLKDAWKDYGYNIDGLATVKESKDVCTRVTGADSIKQEDGKDGIDNSFGRTVLGFILGLEPAPTKTVNDSIQRGDFTIMLEVKGLTDDPKQTSTGLSGRLLIGGPYGENKIPTFAPEDDWPYRAEPIVPLSGAYISNGTFVNGQSGAAVQIALFLQGMALSLNIRRAAITFDHTSPNELTNGTISGVVATEELLSGIEKVASRISDQLCTGSTLDTIKQTIRWASDIRQDGTNGPGATCDGISIGLGFTAKKIGAPTTLAKEAVLPPDPCAAKADGGVEGGVEGGADGG